MNYWWVKENIILEYDSVGRINIHNKVFVIVKIITSQLNLFYWMVGLAHVINIGLPWDDISI